MVEENWGRAVNDKIIALWQKMADHTAPECAHTCRAPHSCCDPMYCEMATETAQLLGVELQTQNHPTLPYMGPNGCVVPPHVRPLCTLHTCAMNSLGFKPGDDQWTRKYFRLRAAIERAEGMSLE